MLFSVPFEQHLRTLIIIRDLRIKKKVFLQKFVVYTKILKKTTMAVSLD